LLASVVLRRFFQGLLGGEVSRMFSTRRLRAVAWAGAGGVLALVLFRAQAEDRVGGPFQARPLIQSELRAPQAGFLRAVYFEEGDRVAARALVARLEVPNLDSRVQEKRAEVREVEARLRLVEAGPRPEEVEAQRARVACLEEEARYLEGLPDKLLLRCPVRGAVVTPRLRERLGQYFREGELVCEVEDSSGLEAEVTLDEQETARIEPGQRVELKFRSFPLRTFRARVRQVAPKGVRGEVQSALVVYCPLEGPEADLRPGTNGYARVYCGPRPIGSILGERALRFLRSEFWMW
jgi:multidrug efflux pump subunit AcrA (membrane-fusion protein)